VLFRSWSDLHNECQRARAAIAKAGGK